MNYTDMYFFFSQKEKKIFFLNLFRKILKENSIRNGTWNLHKNGIHGVVENGEWSWINTVNTNPICISYLCNIYEKENNEKLNFYDDYNYKNDVKKLIDFVDKNWDNIFTLNNSNDYYYELNLKCNKSWSYGQISTFIALNNIKRLFPEYEIKHIDYSMERGDLNDFKGKDMTIYTSCGKEFSFQLKTGIITKYKNSYYVESSVNDLKYDVDYFCFINLKNDDLNIVILKNNSEYIETYGKLKHYKEELNMNKEIKEENKLKNLLRDILFYCNNKKILFEMNLETKENDIIWSSENKTIKINISKSDDQNLYEIFNEKFENLKNLLN